MNTIKQVATLALALVCLGGLSTAHAVTMYTASGSDPASIQATVDDFRAALGILNAPEPISHPRGRREINWDAAPASVATPHRFPGDFFNADVFPRARGVEFRAFLGDLGGGGDDDPVGAAELVLSGARDDGTLVRFSDLNPTYASELQSFSDERLFAPLGGNVVEAKFFLPGNHVQPGLVDGFGVVFTDVDQFGSAKVEYFDERNEHLTTVVAPASDSGGLSFVGATFDDAIVSRVLITTGNALLGETETPIVGGGGVTDVVAMDDMIFGEPQVVPEPTSGMLTLISLVVLAALSRRRR